MNRSLWKRAVFGGLPLLSALGWVFLSAQGPEIVPPFSTTPAIIAYQSSGANAGITLYWHRLSGLYENGRIGTFNPFNWVSTSAAIANVIADGLGNFLNSPGGPPNVGPASQLGGFGKFTSSGTMGVAYITYNGTKVNVALGSASLTYTGVTQYETGQNPRNAITADFNGDSLMDIAVTYAGNFSDINGGVAVLLNKGDGTFNNAVTYASGKMPSGFTAFDVNGDNILDLVVADGGSTNVYVLTGNANGSFNAAAPYATVGSPLSVTVADFNGDSKPDIAASTSEPNGYSILLNNGNGTFRSGTSGTTGYYNSYIATGDFDGDAKLDLAVVDHNTQVVHVLRGSGTGTFQETAAYATSYSPEGLVLTDFNNDGKLDILVAQGDARGFGPDPNNGHIDYLLGRGDCTFAGLQMSATGGISGSLRFTVAGDFNADGKIDAIANNFYSSSARLILFPGDGKGGFSGTGTPVNLGVNVAAPNNVVAADFNSDGRTDLAVASGSTSSSASPGEISVLLNTGSGLGAPAKFTATGKGSFGLAAADFDGDGKVDLAVTNSASGTTDYFRGGGNGTFQLVQTYSTGMAPVALIATDLTGDGKADLVVADKGDQYASTRINGQIYVLKNNGSGGFQSAVQVTVDSVFNSVNLASGDVNGDGKADVVVIGAGPGFSDRMGVLKGNGDGTFAPPLLQPAAFGPQSLAVRDFNGDGKADIVVGHCCGDTDLTYAQGNGDGTFSADVHFAGPASPTGVSVADLNKDGAPDLVVGGSGGQLAGMLNTSTNFPCSYQLDKTSLSPLQQGGTYTINIDAGPACNWSVSGLPDWITVSGASSGTGPGSVTLIVSSTSAARNATFTIAGITVSVTQTLAPVCNYIVAPGGQTFPSSGGTGNFSVTVNPGCNWSVSGIPSWVTINSGSSGSATANGSFTVAANGGSARTATMTIAGQSYIFEQAASSVPGLAFAGSLAQVASQGGWKFFLNEVNLGSSTATARVNFYDNLSNPLQLPVIFPQQGEALTAPAALSTGSPLLASTLDRPINPNAQLLVQSSGADSTSQLIGWGELLTNGQVSGFGIFNHPTLHWEAVVPLETRNASSYVLAFDNTGQVATGLAIASTVIQSTAVQVIIRDDTGAQIGTGFIPLGGKGHTSFMLNQQFPVANGKRGTIEFQTPQNGGITVLGLRANGPALTTLPVLANVTNSGGLIAHTTYNGGFTSIYYIVNTGTSAADFTLSFFNETDGSPLPVPLSLPQTGTTTTTAALTRTVAAKAMLIVETQAQDSAAAVAASAQLTTTGNISGFEVFRWTTFGQEASVALETRTPSSFLLAFDNTGGLTTGVALSNAVNATQNVQVILRDDAGTTLQTTSISLPPRGHTSFLLPSNYANAANKRGLVEFVVPNGGRISVIGLRAKADGTLTTLPVLAR
ncbi:MAG: FG-GAP-like repeat-containing protein [Bryobacteraceae bacterium]